MPLVNGYSPASIQKNIEQLLKDGYEREQAVAIALEIARKAKRKAKKK